MKTETQIFANLAWQEKIKYMVSFYQGMIKKTNNSNYIAKFQAKIDEVKWYEESEENTNKLVGLYIQIMWAREKTKQKRIQETQQVIEKQKQKLARIQKDNGDENPNEYLAKALADI